MRTLSRVGRMAAFTTVIILAGWSTRSVAQRGNDTPVQRLLSVEAHNRKLSLLESQVCPECLEGKRFLFMAESTDGEPFSLSLGDKVVLISEIRIVNQKRAIIIGDIGTSDFTIVSIVDFDTRKVVDEFPAWKPAISPDGRYVAYIKSFIRSGAVGASSQYLVYDATVSPEQNRLADKAMVGLPIFPRGSRNVPGDNMNIPELQVRFPATSLTWLGGTNILAFGDRLERYNDITVVVADLRRDYRNAAIFDHKIEPRDLFGPTSVCAGVLTRPETLEIAALSLSPKAGFVRFALRGGKPQQQCGQFEIQVPDLR